jgi:dUTP pyrophosphatase
VIDASGYLPVQVRQLDSGLALPRYAHPGDAGADLASAEDVVLAPGERRLVGTGMAVAVPDGFAAFVHPRSGLAARHGITIVNAPGTVDAGYRGEIKVCLLNTDTQAPVRISRGDRIAQLVIQPVARATFIAVDALEETTRGAGGHGSTGGMPDDAVPASRSAVSTGLYAAEAEGVNR